MVHPRCVILPLPDHQVAFQIDGFEKSRWHFGPNYPRPFFYPLIGPASGLSLTRMGHPGAPNHDHHRSIWFAHEKVQGVNFWGDNTTARIRQKEWLAYEDGNDEACMAVRLGWNDGHDPKDLMSQELIAAIRPAEKNDYFLEIQTTFRPQAMLELGKTNFGFLAIRVAKAISTFFGGGLLTNSHGKTSEADLFGQPARWVDYSGEQRGPHREGVTFFDHPSNPGHPNSWHVREDGWIGAAPTLREGKVLTPMAPLTLRYLFHAHTGPVDSKKAEAAFGEFSDSKPWELVKNPAKHTAWGVQRKKA